VNATETEIDLFAGLPSIMRDCVDPDGPGRYDLRRPWRDGGYIYATDGRIIARVREDDCEWHLIHEIPAREVGRQPVARDVYEVEAIEDTPLWLPSPLSGLQACEECGGTGRDPDAEPHQVECYDCSGGGTCRDSDPYEIAPDFFLGGWLIALLIRHGATAYRTVGRTKGPQPIWFRTPDGAEGMAMPMDPHRIGNGGQAKSDTHP
jgi:hypothetical protein